MIRTKRSDSSTSLGKYSAEVEQEARDIILHAQKELNPNMYSGIKTITQGILDIALFTTHVALLRRILKQDPPDPFFWVIFILIVTVMCLQVITGFFLAVLFCSDRNKEFGRMLTRIVSGVWTRGSCFIYCCAFKRGGCHCSKWRWSPDGINVLVTVFMLLITVINACILVLADDA